MTRALYIGLLRLHPSPFRRQFADEMLWIFDEAKGSEGAWVLLLDLVVSVSRQWLLRSAVWKAAFALAGAVVQITLGGLGWIFFNPRFCWSSEGGAAVTPAVTELLQITLCMMFVLVALVFTLVLWTGGFTRKRSGKRARTTCSNYAVSRNFTPASRR
jgi:hypothetical protein